jgi:glycosyltransferase involved in cell wall biosynthesis
MNILILTTHLNPGGLSRYVLNLAKGLTRKNHKVWVASSGGEWLTKLNTGSTVNHKLIPIKTKSICSPKILFSFLSLRKLAIKEDVQVIHCNTRVTQFLGFLVSRSLKIPYLSAFHGFYRSTWMRRTFKFSGQAAIAVSQAVKNHLVADLEINREKVKVVYNGVDLSQFQAKQYRSGSQISGNDYSMGILGRISQEKGHFLALEALNQLLTKYPDLKLLVSGKGKLEESFKEAVKKSGLEARVKFVDFEANRFLDKLNLLLVPSSKEGFGYSIIEAFAKGVPVVGYNTGGIAEIIENKKNGILFNNYTGLALAEAIEEMILKDHLREKMIISAKQDAEKFSIEKMAANTEKVYWRILQ